MKIKYLLYFLEPLLRRALLFIFLTIKIKVITLEIRNEVSIYNPQWLLIAFNRASTFPDQPKL